MKRKIIITIDSLIELFKCYTDGLVGDIPDDTQALSLQVNRNDKGKFRILAESSQWSEGLAPLVVNFSIKRIYSV